MNRSLLSYRYFAIDMIDQLNQYDAHVIRYRRWKWLFDWRIVDECGDKCYV